MITHHNKHADETADNTEDCTRKNRVLQQLNKFAVSVENENPRK